MQINTMPINNACLGGDDDGIDNEFNDFLKLNLTSTSSPAQPTQQKPIEFIFSELIKVDKEVVQQAHIGIHTLSGDKDIDWCVHYHYVKDLVDQWARPCGMVVYFID